jgi:hypothetical protein
MKRMMSILPALAASLCGGPQLAAATAQVADPPPPVVKGPTPAAPAPALGPASAAPAPPAAAPADTPAPPPSAPAQRSAADLEKLVAPLALFPDPLIATMLPASVYPLEIVQAARFVADTNNLAKLDAQPWDQNVKAVARIPDAIKKMNDDLAWTVELGEAFLAQDKEVMDAIQNLRGKAQKAGTLRSTPQQVVVVTNLVVVQTNATQVVTVTNQIVQIQPSNPSVVYVPTYNPTTVYYPPPAYVYDPIAPLVTFTAGVAMGAIIANNCDWWHGGCYHGDVDVDVDVDRNVNRNVNRNTDRAGNTARNTQAGARPSTTQKKWQPDQSRLRTSGSSGAASARTSEARGWSSGGARPSTQPGAAARPSASPGNVGARPSTGTPAARPSTGTPSASRPSTSQGASRPSASPGASANRPAPSANRASSSGSAFGGVSNGASARSSSSRGASSRGGGFSGGRGGGRR